MLCNSIVSFYHQILSPGEWVCPQCKMNDSNTESSIKSPNRSALRTSHSSPTKSITLKGSFKKLPAKPKPSRSPSSQVDRNKLRGEKRKLRGSSKQSEDFVDIWEFNDESVDVKETSKKPRRTTPKKNGIELNKYRIFKEKRTPKKVRATSLGGNVVNLDNTSCHKDNKRQARFNKKKTYRVYKEKQTQKKPRLIFPKEVISRKRRRGEDRTKSAVRTKESQPGIIFLIV